VFCPVDTRKAFGRLPCEHEMDVVRHQATRPDFDGRPAAALCREAAIERAVGGIEENCQAAIAPLSYAMWIGRDHDAAETRDARHGSMIALSRAITGAGAA
jgi:hypothetical protein